MKIKQRNEKEWIVIPSKKMQLCDVQTGERLDQAVFTYPIELEDAMLWFYEIHK